MATNLPLCNVTVDPQANVYFDGKCVSHTVTLADGSRKSVGVILPSTLLFNTGAPEVMQAVAGACEVRLAGETGWTAYAAGTQFSVGANTSFEIRVVDVPFHYVCHFG